MMIRRPEVLKICGYSSATLDRRITEGLFTPPVKLGGSRACGWPYKEVEVIEVAITAGWTTNRIKVLVTQLVQQRQEDARRLESKFKALHRDSETHPNQSSDVSEEQP